MKSDRKPFHVILGRGKPSKTEVWRRPKNFDYSVWTVAIIVVFSRKKSRSFEHTGICLRVDSYHAHYSSTNCTACHRVYPFQRRTRNGLQKLKVLTCKGLKRRSVAMENISYAPSPKNILITKNKIFCNLNIRNIGGINFAVFWSLSKILTGKVKKEKLSWTGHRLLFASNNFIHQLMTAGRDDGAGYTHLTATTYLDDYDAYQPNSPKIFECAANWCQTAQ